MEHCSSHSCASAGGSHAKKPIIVLVGVALVIFLLTLIASNIKKFHYIGRPEPVARSLTISGSGKVTATPNIAVTNVGLVTEKSDVATAQQENSEKMNALIAALKELKIKDEDIRTTQYQIYPKYSYEEKKGSAITGYSVSQSVEVKIRDLKNISAVLARAGEAGANQVSGITFTIDEPKNLRAQAREEAVKDAKDKAAKLAEQLGVKLGRVITFSESGGGQTPEPRLMYMKEGIGGGDSAPDIQSGSLEIISNVDVTFELK